MGPPLLALNDSETNAAITTSPIQLHAPLLEKPVNKPASVLQPSASNFTDFCYYIYCDDEQVLDDVERSIRLVITGLEYWTGLDYWTLISMH